MQQDQNPYDALSRYFTFPDRDQYSWWVGKGRLLSKMLVDAAYSEQQQYQYLSFFKLHLIPALGPCGSQSTEGERDSLSSASGRIEFSITYRQAGRSVRIAFEPTSFLASSPHDPFNKRRTQQLLSDLEQLDISIDATLYHSLFDTLVVSDEDEETLKDTEVKFVFLKTQHILSLDLQGGDVSGELYVYPHMKSLATGIPGQDLLWEAVKRIDRQCRLQNASRLLNEYLQSQASQTTDVMFLSSDLAAPSRALCRLFISEAYFSWEGVQRSWTLGGALNDSATMAGLELVQILWGILELPEGPPAPDAFPLLFVYELRPDQPHIWQKIGIPVHGMSEAAVADACAAFFRCLGWEGHADSYKSFLESY